MKPEGDRKKKTEKKKQRQIREHQDKPQRGTEKAQAERQTESNRDRERSSLFDSLLRQAWFKYHRASTTFTGILSKHHHREWNSLTFHLL